MRTTPSRNIFDRGAALIIVLAFIVLLTGLVMAYFSRSMTDRQLANSSFNQGKVDAFARSAVDIIVGDLKQEIVNGSTTPAPTPSADTTLYVPVSAANMVPARNLPGAEAAAIPDLIRVSRAADPIAAPGIGSRASAVNSATDVSLNGRSITPARWNRHYLIPRFDMGATVDSTPDASTGFVAPDWVFVTNQGPQVITVPNTAVVGRYAYAIYDEGGLLDMNVAGYPADAVTSGGTNGLTITQVGQKGVLALADLTQLPISKSGTSYLSQSEVDNIIGWRNYASAQLTSASGSFGNVFFNTTNAGAWLANIVSSGTASGFLQVYNGTTGTPPRTDQALLSRQQLLQLQKSLGFSQDALQYMGTFSRDLEQPGFFPGKDLPLIRSGTRTSNGAGGNATTWGTGNDAYGSDRYSGASQKSPNDINPEFLSVRVLQSFTRTDGTTANVGDPLVNKRFPLSRLGLVLRTATAAKSDSDPIYKYFGIYRSSPSDPWLYDHGDPAGILRLSNPGSPGGVAQRNRDPDFFELLKAAINVGSVGKSALFQDGGDDVTVANSMSNLQHQLDVSSALQILQIGADIIDQYDTDGYPTRIAFGGATDKVVSGIEDLPYIESIRNHLIFVTSTVGTWLMQPVLWNPHDPNAVRPAGYGSNSPKNFRIRVFTADHDPSHGAAVDIVNFSSNNDWPINTMDYDLSPPLGGPLTFNAGEANGYYGFRQPTLLGEANIPAGTNVQGNNVSQADADTGTQFVGLQIASNFPLKLPNKTDPTKYDYLVKASWNLKEDPSTGSASSLSIPGIEFALEYQDDSGNWIQYDDFRFVPDGSGIGWFNTGINTDAKASNWIKTNYASTGGYKAVDLPCAPPWSNSGSTRLKGGTRTDPRTSRWRTTVGQYLNLRPGIDRVNNIYETARGGTGISFGDHIGGKADNGFVGGGAYGSENWYRGYQHAYAAENSVRDTQQESGETSLKRYNRDPDGVVRRGMAGFATDSLDGGSFGSILGLPFATNNFTSRPLILNRPFSSVAELGHAWRGSPWKNLDFSFPESGDAALLDVFCINEVPAGGMVAGRINLNTRQPSTLRAIIAGANLDPASATSQMPGTSASEVAQKLAARNSDLTVADRLGPMISRAGLVGTWNPITGNSSTTMGTDIDPDHYYTGFTSDIGTVPSLAGQPAALIPRLRESAVRALGDVGTTRVWNLMIDVIAQTGEYAGGGGAKFVVEGEKRYWVHIAIDRLTGKILDQQLEQVSE